MLNETLFSQTYDQITKSAIGAGLQNFQMIAATIPFDFQTAGPGQMDPGIYQIVSQMPVWSAVGTYGLDGTTLFSAYRQLLANVTFKVDPAKQADLARQASQINEQQRQLNAALANQNQAYNVAVSNGGAVFAAQYPTINDWLAGPGSTYAQQVSTLTAAIKVLNDKYANDLAAMQGDQSLTDSLNATISPATAPSAGPAKPGWILVPDSGGTLQWQPEFVLGKTPDQVIQDLTSGTSGGFQLTLSTARGSSSSTHSWAGADGGYNSLFFSVGGSGGWDKLDIADDDASVQVDISVKSATTDIVTPGVWYNGGFLKNLAQNQGAGGYQLAAGWTPTGATNAAFGEHGLLSTMVAQLLLVYQPAVTITMAASTYQRNYQKINASGGLRIGPFSFGGSGGHTSDYTLKTDGSTSFTVTSTSTIPQLIGVSVGFPGGVTPPA